jgi:hypothetical protein
MFNIYTYIIYILYIFNICIVNNTIETSAGSLALSNQKNNVQKNHHAANPSKTRQNSLKTPNPPTYIKLFLTPLIRLKMRLN